MRRRGILGPAFIFGMVACGGAAALGSTSGFRTVLLDQGRVGRYDWEVGVARDRGKRGSKKPCVKVALVDLKPTHSPFGMTIESDLSLCSALGARRAPNIASVSMGRGEAEGTVLGMAFAPSIEAVRLDLGARGEREVRPKLLNDRQRSIAGVGEFRYIAIALAGPTCLHQIVALGKGGEELYRGPPETCPK